MATWRALTRARHFRDFDGLRHQWVVSVSESCRIDALTKRLPALLACAEAAGVASVEAELEAVGVRHASTAADDRQPGRVYLRMEVIQ